MISYSKQSSVEDLVNEFSQTYNAFLNHKKLFPHAKSILIESLDEWYTVAPEIQKIGDDVDFVSENIKLKEDWMTIMYAIVFKDLEIDGKSVSIFSEPFIPLYSYTGVYDNIMFMNYVDVIHQYFFNDEAIINKCDEYIFDKFKGHSKENLVYFPSRLKKLLTFT